jgi:hypothetical protein
MRHSLTREENDYMIERIKKLWKEYEKMMLYNVIKNKKKLFFGTIAVSFMIVYSVVEIGEMFGFNVYGVYFAIAGFLFLGIAYLV